MTKNEQRRFIRELIRNVQTDVLAHVAKMPNDWDGFEWRRYIADKFEDAAYVKLNAARAREYRNTVTVQNL